MYSCMYVCISTGIKKAMGTTQQQQQHECALVTVNKNKKNWHEVFVEHSYF